MKTLPIDGNMPFGNFTWSSSVAFGNKSTFSALGENTFRSAAQSWVCTFWDSTGSGPHLFGFWVAAGTDGTCLFSIVPKSEVGLTVVQPILLSMIYADTRDVPLLSAVPSRGEGKKMSHSSLP